MIRGALVAVTANGPVPGPACCRLALTEVDRFELATPVGGVGLLIGRATLGTRTLHRR